MAKDIKSLIKVKPKAYKDGEVINISFMVMHPMHTGMGKDKKTNEIIPASYINSIKFEYKGEVISTMNVWESVSTNPVFTIGLKVNGAGDLKVTFTENTGEVHTTSKKIKPKA